LRYDYTDGKRFWEPDVTTAILGLPESGWQSDLLMGLRMKSQKPYAHNLIHPLDGWGFEPRITIATKALGGRTEYIRPDVRAYTILPGLGNSRFYLYGRAIAQKGNSFNQDYIGFSRYDELQFGDLMPGLDFIYSDTERVRGFSDYVVGDRMLFGTIEYRMPLLNSLQTQFLGLISLGRTTIAGFLDAGAVWSEPDNTGSRELTNRAGTGFELKNVLNIGPLSIIHSLGFAQPVPDFGGSQNREVYYRVQTTIPF
jgi:outer membrane protein assembly factor BamA